MKQRRDIKSYVSFLAVVLFFSWIAFLANKGDTTGFAVFGSNSDYNLTTWLNETAQPGRQVTFYANFSNTTGSLIPEGEGIVCTFSENSSGSWSPEVNMTFDGVASLYAQSVTFNTTGTGTYNISCFNLTLSNISLVEQFIVTTCVPPASGDWVINGSQNVVCQNIPSLVINGSINITGTANLTIRNVASLYADSSRIMLFDNASMIFDNSSTISYVYLFNNASLRTNGSSIFEVDTYDFSRIWAVSSYFDGLFMTPAEELALSDLNQNSNLTLYLSSQNAFYNFTNLRIANIELYPLGNLNLTNSNITALYPQGPSRVNVVNSAMVYLTSYPDSTLTLSGSAVSSLSLLKTNLTGRNTSITSALSIINETHLLSDQLVIAQISAAVGNLFFEGNYSITQKTIPSFSNITNITRFYPIYIYNGGLPLNGSVNITHLGNILWAGTLTDGYALANLTFNSTTYTEQYNLNTPLGYVGKISLLDNTPINKSSRLSEIPLYLYLDTVNGTVFNDTIGLMFSVNKPVECFFSFNGTYSNATKYRGGISLANTTANLYYNSTLNDIRQVIGPKQMPLTFTNGTFSEFRGSTDNDIAYTEELVLGDGENSGRVNLMGYGVSPYPSNQDARIYLYFNDVGQDKMYSYLLRFNNSVNYNNFSEQSVRDDLLNSTIRIQGEEFTITDLKVNSTSHQLMNLTLSRGTTAWNIPDFKETLTRVTINSSNISLNAFAYILGTPGHWTGLNITTIAHNRTYVAAGESFTDPVFGRWKFAFLGMQYGNTEKIRFSSNGTLAILNFTSIENKEVLIPYQMNASEVKKGYLPSQQFLLPGETITTSPAGQAGTKLYVVKSDGSPRILNISSITEATNAIVFQDLTNGTTYASQSYVNLSDSSNTFSLAGIGDIVLNISSDHRTLTYDSSPGKVAKTKYGAEITLDNTSINVREIDSLGKNKTIFVNATYDAPNMNVTFKYLPDALFTQVGKYYGSMDVLLTSTTHGSLIESVELNNSLVEITYPQSPAYAKVSIAAASADVGSDGNFYSDSYAASSEYGLNNLSLYCTDGVETIYRTANAYVSKMPSVLLQEITTAKTSAVINITTTFAVTSTLNYGDTKALENTKSHAASAATGYYLSSLGSDTRFYYNVSLCDAYNRCLLVGDNTFRTLTADASASTSTRTTTTSFVGSTDPFATRRIADIAAGGTYSFDLNYGTIPVSRVEFVPKRNLDYLQVRFFNLKNSSEVPALSDESKLFTYLRFNISYAKFDDILEMNITFKVDKEWFDKKGMDKSQVTLNRYSDGWAEIPTQYEYEDHFYHYYKAKVPGFSVFAITATKGSLPAAVVERPSEVAAGNTTSPSAPTQPQNPSTPSTDLPPAQPPTNREEDLGSDLALPQDESPSALSIADRISSITNSKLFIPLLVGVLAMIVVGGGFAVARKPRGMVQELAKRRMSKEEIISELKAKGVYGQSLEEMRQFISASLHQGKNANEIKAALLSVGWEEHILDDVFQLFGLE